MICMSQAYIDQVWRCYEERHIGFTYRSKFERKIKNLPKELQAIIFTIVWNKGKDTLWKCMPGNDKSSWALLQTQRIPY